MSDIPIISVPVKGRPITPEVLEDFAKTLQEVAELMRGGRAEVSGGFYSLAGVVGPVLELDIVTDMTVHTLVHADKHHTFRDCLDAPDAAISYFRDTGEGYCHVCQQWHAQAVEKERHARGGLNRAK